MEDRECLDCCHTQLPALQYFTYLGIATGGAADTAASLFTGVASTFAEACLS